MPDPLHPAIVHFPIALAILLPLLGLLALLSIWRGALPARVWWGVVLLQALLAGSAWWAIETGEEEEERVEHVVAEQHIHEHEEAAERLLLLSGVGLVIVAAGLLPRRAGGIARVAGVVFAVGVAAASIDVGRLGGALVYEHGAANAYLEAAPHAADR
jgi:uncharacterized membrane protein